MKSCSTALNASRRSSFDNRSRARAPRSTARCSLVMSVISVQRRRGRSPVGVAQDRRDAIVERVLGLAAQRREPDERLFAIVGLPPSQEPRLVPAGMPRELHGQELLELLVQVAVVLSHVALG